MASGTKARGTTIFCTVLVVGYAFAIASAAVAAYQGSDPARSPHGLQFFWLFILGTPWSWMLTLLDAFPRGAGRLTSLALPLLTAALNWLLFTIVMVRLVRQVRDAPAAAAGAHEN